MSFSNDDENEFELDRNDDSQDAGESITPDNEEEDKFVELTNEEYDALPLVDRRRYTTRLESYRRKKKREEARLRKAAQRKREKQGIPTGLTNKIVAAWKANLDSVQTDPSRADELAMLESRLNDIDVMERKVIDAMDALHKQPDAEATGWLLEFVVADLIEHGRKFGIAPWEPPFLIVMKLEAMNHMTRDRALQELRNNPAYHYRVHFGLDIDHVRLDEYYGGILPAFFTWYLDRRLLPHFRYQWDDADEIVKSFEIPEKYITEPYGEDPGRIGGPKTVWARLHNFRNGIKPTPYRHEIKSASEILENDAKLLRTLTRLGY
jgi:hypothetical protein